MIIAILSSLIGFFGLAVVPLGNELVVEVLKNKCEREIDEATSSGMLIVGSQIQGILFLLLMQVVSHPFSLEDVQTK